MSDFHSFEIEIGAAGVGGKILLDGQELRGVRGFTFAAEAGGLTEIVLRMVPDKVTLRAEEMALVEALGVKYATIEGTDLTCTSRVYRRVPVEVAAPESPLAVPIAVPLGCAEHGCTHPEEAMQELRGMGGAPMRSVCTKCGCQIPEV